MSLHRYIAIVVCVLCFFSLSAQIEFVVPSYNHKIAQAEKPLLKKSNKVETLPFVDDFALDGPFPNPDFWIDNHVFVNTDLAVSPPSIGVATFDGIDNTGSPYGMDGAGDTLTSVEINLDVVPSDLHISYFIQPKGFGEQPEFSDSLILEFKNDMGEWIIQRAYTGPPMPVATSEVSFMFDFVEITSSAFLHENFQFRFRNKSSGAGAVDLWHLDMVRLFNNRVPSASFNDRAFQNRSEGILGRYSAMPAVHFQNNTSSHLRDAFTLNIFNHADQARPIGSPNSVIEITELNSGQIVQAPKQFLVGSNLNIAADSSIQISIPANFSVSPAIANSSDELVFETKFTLDAEDAGNELGLTNNNIIRTQTIVDDYFAYDDGTSELSILAQGPGTNIAVEFQSSADDTLSAVAIQFPHINGDITNQFFNLKVWLNDLTSEPIFEGELLNPLFVDRFVDTLQGFTTYRLQETFTEELRPVEIPANTTFYVGWEQVSNEFLDAIAVGFDITTEGVSQFNWFSTNGVSWTSFESANLEGAVMIRPIMGTENAIFTSLREANERRGITIYPNPNNSGIINVKQEDVQNQIREIRVLDLAGRLMYAQDWQSDQIDLQRLSAGIYFINFVDSANNIIHREKLILQ